MNLRRAASVLGTTAVAGIAAYASYQHMRALALRAGQTVDIATVIPLSVDGMIVVASVALVDGRAKRGTAWLAFWVGVAASVLANVLAAQPTWLARCVSAWPSVALLLTIEVIARGGRKIMPDPIPENMPAEIIPPVPPAQPPAGDAIVTPRITRQRPTAAPKVAAARARKPGATPAQIAAAVGVSESTARRHLAVNGSAPVGGSGT